MSDIVQEIFSKAVQRHGISVDANAVSARALAERHTTSQGFYCEVSDETSKIAIGSAYVGNDGAHVCVAMLFDKDSAWWKYPHEWHYFYKNEKGEMCLL